MNDNDEQRLLALPVWQGDIEWQPLSGGLSNQSFLVTDRGGTTAGTTATPARYVARFGHDFPFHHVFRDREIIATQAAVDAGFAPELCFAEPGRMVSRFIDGKTYDEADISGNLERIAVLIHDFHHKLPHYVSGPAHLFWVFHVIRDYAKTLQKGGSRMIPRLAEFVSLANELEAVQVPLPIIYGHHDLLPANFIDDGDKIWLIDFEYAGFSTAMFDLANIAANAGFNTEQSAELLATYFATEIGEDYRCSHAAMQCASVLREAMWSMVSELHLDVPGVDYVAYTEENLQQLDIVLDNYRTRFGSAS